MLGSLPGEVEHGLRFVREDLWRAAQLQQSLVGGDTLRTNAIGNLAILFKDQTQIRVGRNSTLTVNDVAGGDGGNTQLSLQAGNIWARAARGGSGVDVKTPAAVAAIRGTDWSLSVDGAGKTSLIVLEGVVELSNPQGSVTVRQGEGAVAAVCRDVCWGGERRWPASCRQARRARRLAAYTKKTIASLAQHATLVFVGTPLRMVRAAPVAGPSRLPQWLQPLREPGPHTFETTGDA